MISIILSAIKAADRQGIETCLAAHPEANSFLQRGYYVLVELEMHANLWVVSRIALLRSKAKAQKVL